MRHPVRHVQQGRDFIANLEAIEKRRSRDSHPFGWTAVADSLLESIGGPVRRGCHSALAPSGRELGQEATSDPPLSWGAIGQAHSFGTARARKHGGRPLSRVVIMSRGPAMKVNPPVQW